MDLIQNVTDPQEASDLLLQHALSNFSTDNTSVMVVRFALTGEVNSASAAAAGAGAGASAAAGQRPPAQGETERDGSKSAPSLGPAKGATNEAGATLA